MLEKIYSFGDESTYNMIIVKEKGWNHYYFFKLACNKKQY